MILLRLCRYIFLRLLVVMILISSFTAPSAFCEEKEDSQVFIAGFNAYQQKDYASSIEKMNEVLQKYPGTPLRDMALFWLSRAYFKAGNQLEAARHFSQFSKEYPDNPLRNTVEDELLALTARYEKGEKLAAGPPPVKQAGRLTTQKEKAQKEQAAAAESARLAALKRAEEKTAADLKEAARITSAKAERERLAKETAVETSRVNTQKAEAELARVNALKAENERKLAAESARPASAKGQEKPKTAALSEVNDQSAKPAYREKALAGINAYQQKDYRSSIEILNEVLHKYPNNPLRDMELFWLSRAYYKAGNQQEAARHLAQLSREYPDNQLINSVEDELLSLMARYEKGEKLPTAATPVKQSDIQLAQKPKSDRSPVATVAPAPPQTVAVSEEKPRKSQQRLSEKKGKSAKAAYREKAIEQYKTVINKFPASTAAVTAATKLRELGVPVAALPAQAPAEPPLAENAQVLRLEVAQSAGFEFNLLSRPESFIVGQPVLIPFEVVNRGNGNDSFYLESAFPADFKARFASSASPGVAISQTPDLAPGQAFKGVIDLVIPTGSIDGQRFTHPVKAASRLMAEASQSREVRLVASAPLLRAVVRTDKTRPAPGEKVLYRISILNVGSTAAQDLTFRLNFPPQLDPVDYASAGFRQEMKSALVLDGLRIKSGENREISVFFQLKDDSLAGQELTTHAELIHNPLKTRATFVSNSAFVEPQRSVSVRIGSDSIVAIPGQTVTVPFVVTNTGNIREKFSIKSVVTGAKDAIVFHDLNRDGIRQATEPTLTEIGPLAPREEASIVVEIKTPISAVDNSQGRIQLSFASEGDAARSATGATIMTYSRPALKMIMTGRDGRLKPGDVASFDLTLTNSGSNLARVVELQSAWPEQLELVAADPATTTVVNGSIIWRFKEMGAGEKRGIKVSFRVKQGTGAGTAIQVKNILTYEDQLGNKY